MKTAFVLWIYYSFSWTWLVPGGSIPMTPGWVSVDTYATEEACVTAGHHQEYRATMPFACTDPMWTLNPLAKIDPYWNPPTHQRFILPHVDMPFVEDDP